MGRFGAKGTRRTGYAQVGGGVWMLANSAAAGSPAGALLGGALVGRGIHNIRKADRMSHGMTPAKSAKMLKKTAGGPRRTMGMKKGPSMSRSQAASVAAKARWHGGGRKK